MATGKIGSRLLAGTVEDEYGSADKAPLENGAKEMFFVLRKAK